MIQKIISGGQTGADRAALDFAIEHGIPHGGWCPKGRLAEDGMIDARYSLQETSTSKYPQRTEKNVHDAAGQLLKFLEEHQISVLNVAGSRASKEPGVYEFVMTTLNAVIQR